MERRSVGRSVCRADADDDQFAIRDIIYLSPLGLGRGPRIEGTAAGPAARLTRATRSHFLIVFNCNLLTHAFFTLDMDMGLVAKTAVAWVSSGSLGIAINNLLLKWCNLALTAVVTNSKPVCLVFQTSER